VKDLKKWEADGWFTARSAGDTTWTLAVAVELISVVKVLCLYNFKCPLATPCPLVASPYPWAATPYLWAASPYQWAVSPSTTILN